MITIPGYTVVDIAYSSATSTVYRGYDSQDASPVVIKVLNNEFPTHLDLTRIRRGYEIAKELDFEGVLRPINLVPFQQSYALVLEDFGGMALSIIMEDHKPDLLSCIKIAIGLAETLGRIHQRGIVHKNIKSTSVIINEETGQARLTDFSIASRVFGEKQEHVSPELLEGTLAYISPEQTGRIDRGIDYHSDLYSFGVVLYEMLTGVLPFTAEDVGGLVYCHLAVTPKPPAELDSGIPVPLSDIVMKLLAKNAEERYRSAFGLKHDLEKCLDQYTAGTVERFVLGARDVPITLRIPEKLYGREEETTGLMNAFSQAAQGRSGIIMVKGPPGIGKSVLINELYKPVIEQNGYFASGKFDQFKRDVPYSALRQAFGGITRQLLSERAGNISDWKAKLHYALGPNGRIIVDLIPEMELIIGKQPPVETLPPTQSRNRFNMVFTGFIRVFARREHPLVLFLDDIQWADRGTLKLMELLATAPDMNSLLLIGAYRDTEVDSAHPLILMLDEISRTGFTVNEIPLSPLPVNGIVELITDMLVCERSDAETLAGVIMKKTHGNPFFINQFMRDLYQKEILRFDTEKYSWVWDISTIETADITTNVVEFMCGKIKELSATAQNALTIASCIGSRFDLGLLAEVNERTVSDTAEVLGESQQEGLLAPIGVSYKYSDAYADEEPSAETGITYMFLHDRIQQRENPGQLQIFLEFTSVFLRLRGRKPEALLDLPEMTDKKQRMIVSLIMNTLSTAYLTNKDLFAFFFSHWLRPIQEDQPDQERVYLFC